MNRLFLLSICLLVSHHAFAATSAKPNVALDQSGQPIPMQLQAYHQSPDAMACQCGDGRLFHVGDKLIDNNDPNARLEVKSIKGMLNLSRYAEYREHPETPVIAACDFEISGTTFNPIEMEVDPKYKLHRNDVNAYNSYLYSRSYGEDIVCNDKRYVADPRLAREYEFHPESGDELIIGRDDPDANASANKIKTDNQDVDLDGDIVKRMTNGDGVSGMPMLFPRKGEVVVANRPLQITDSTGKKRKIPVGTLGVVSRREEGSIAVTLYYTKNPNLLKAVFGMRMEFPCYFGQWCPTVVKAESQRLSFDGNIQEGDFVTAEEFLSVTEEAAKNLPANGAKK